MYSMERNIAPGNLMMKTSFVLKKKERRNEMEGMMHSVKIHPGNPAFCERKNLGTFLFLQQKNIKSKVILK